jgi:hypothetical protein
MKESLSISLLLAGCLAFSPTLHAQAAPTQNPAQPQAPAATQKPASQDANPFPEDTTNVPVMPSKSTPALPPDPGNGDDSANGPRLALPGENRDPMRSPDDALPESDGGIDNPSAVKTNSSSSLTGMDKILPTVDGDDPTTGKHRKLAVPEPEHQETSKEDIQVGSYYLDTKNWKAALSRFESAMVLAPDEPEVYWGLAESERHMGKLAEARGYYQKVAEYDPDSKHGKESIKLLKDPEIANAKATPPPAPAK